MSRSSEGRLDEHLRARGGGRFEFAALYRGYVDCALSGSSARGRGEPGVGDPVFALVGKG